MSLNTSSAQKEYFARPASQRYWGLDDMMPVLQRRDSARGEETFDLSQINVVPTDDNDIALDVRGNGRRSLLRLNNWTFDQLATSLKASPSEMRQYGDNPSLLASMFQHRMGRVSRGESPILALEGPDDSDDIIKNSAFGAGRNRDQNDRQLKILADSSGGELTAVSITGASYGRIWDSSLMQLASKALDYGFVTPRGWARGDDPRNRLATSADVFPCSIIKVGDKIGPAGAYLDDRSVFLYLVRPVEVGPGLYPFLIVRNSEVGEVGTLDGLCGLLGATCGNHSMFSARDVKSVSVRHKREAVKSFAEEFKIMLELEAKAAPINPALLKALGSATLGKSADEVVETVFKNRANIGLPLAVSKRFLNLAVDSAESHPEDWSGAQPLSYWWMAQGMTRASQLPVGSRQWAGGRLAVDKAAGQLLDSFDRSGLAVSESVPAIIDVNGSVVSTTPAKRGRKAIANN